MACWVRIQLILVMSSCTRGGTSLPLFIEELGTLVDRVRATIQPLIVLMSPYYVYGFDQYGPHFNKATLEIFHQFADATRKLAGEKDCLFADVLTCYGNADWLIHSVLQQISPAKK